MKIITDYVNFTFFCLFTLKLYWYFWNLLENRKLSDASWFSRAFWVTHSTINVYVIMNSKSSKGPLVLKDFCSCIGFQKTLPTSRAVCIIQGTKPGLSSWKKNSPVQSIHREILVLDFQVRRSVPFSLSNFMRAGGVVISI